MSGLDMAGVVRAVRSIVQAAVGPGVPCYAAGDPDAPLPPSIATGPAILIWPGESREVVTTSTTVTHTYLVEITIVQGGAYEWAPVDVLPMVDQVMAALATRVRLGRDDVIAALLRGSRGFGGIEYGGAELIGYQLAVEVTQRTTLTPGP